MPKKIIKKIPCLVCNACQLADQLLKRMPTLLFLQMAPGVDTKFCNACQLTIYNTATHTHANLGLKIYFAGNACQKMNFDSISQVNPYSNSRSINVAFSPGVMSLYAASVGSHTFGRPGGGQKCGPRRRPPMCIHFPQVLGT